MKTTPDQFMASLDLPAIYRVGGSVRDELIGRPSKDADYVVTGATIPEIKAELLKAAAKPTALKLRTGQQIGWRAAVKGLGLIEICLPRIENSTGSGRHDFAITVNPNVSLQEDAFRRDFTINALYRNIKTGDLSDPLQYGCADLKKKLLATTHEKSFEEDPLRILRGLRFISQLDFRLSSSTRFEMKRLSSCVNGLTQKGVSGTALDELCKLLLGKRPGAALREAAHVGVLQVLLPELEPMIGYEQRSRYHEKTTSDHTFDAIEAAARMGQYASLRVRLALLFHDCGKPRMAWTDKDGYAHYYALSPDQALEMKANSGSLLPHEWWSAAQAELALERLNAPKKLTKDALTLIERHMLPLHQNIRPYKVRKWRSELGDDLLHDLIVHRCADVLGKGGDTTDAMSVLKWISGEQERAKSNKVPIKAQELEVRGQEILDLGAQGKQIGQIQRLLLQEVLAQPKLNDKEWLIDRAADHLQEITKRKD